MKRFGIGVVVLSLALPVQAGLMSLGLGRGAAFIVAVSMACIGFFGFQLPAFVQLRRDWRALDQKFHARHRDVEKFLRADVEAAETVLLELASRHRAESAEADRHRWN